MKNNKRKKQSKPSKLKSNQNQDQLESMKAEIANEFGVNLGANATSRQNGKVGGEITRRLIAKSQGKKRNKK